MRIFSLLLVDASRKQEHQPVRSRVHERTPSTGQSSHPDPADGDRRRETVRNQQTTAGVTRMCQQDSQQVSLFGDAAWEGVSPSN